MLYQAYQAHSDIMVPVRSWATAALRAFGQPLAGIADNAVLRNLSAAYELIARTGCAPGLRHRQRYDRQSRSGGG
jgi:poly-beta-hydroxyalkanoate depolymerase